MKPDGWFQHVSRGVIPTPLGFICPMYNYVWSDRPTLSSLLPDLVNLCSLVPDTLVKDSEEEAARPYVRPFHSQCVFCIAPCDCVVWMCAGDVWDWSNVCGLCQLRIDSISVEVDDLPCLLALGLFWEQRTAQLGTPPVRSLTGPSSITQQSPPLPHSMLTVPMIEEDQRHYSACPPPHTDSRHSVTAHTPFHRMQSMPTNHFHHVGHVTNVRPQREWSKLLTLMPGPCPGTQNMSGHFPPPSCSNEVPLYSFPRPLHSNSASLYSDPGPTPLGHRGMPCSADEASANWWPVGPSHMAPDSQQPIPPQSSPQVMLHANALYFGAVSGLANEQLTSSPSPFSTGINQHAFQPNAWQQRPWLHSRSGSGSPADSGLFSLQSSSSMVGRSVDSIVEQMGSDDAEGFLQPETPTQMCEALLSGSSCSAGGSSLEEHESSKKLHRQESFDEGNVLKQRSYPDSMDSGITGSQASLDNEDDAQPT